MYVKIVFVLKKLMNIVIW